jgi:hypothetical protein
MRPPKKRQGKRRLLVQNVKENASFFNEFALRTHLFFF